MGAGVATRIVDMTIPLQILFRGLDHSDAIEQYVRHRAHKLTDVGQRVVACHVAIEAPHRSKHHGRHYRVRLDVAVPGAELVVDRCPDEGREYEDVYAAIDHAFDHAFRRLREAERRRWPSAPRQRGIRVG
jgi:ribosome-associated translation inhibitor RaiA